MVRNNQQKNTSLYNIFCSFYKELRSRYSGDPTFSTFLNQKMHSRKFFETLEEEKKIFKVIYFDSFL